ncbi:MAG: phosphonate ABC transporter, permease protein PhnE, partial [Cyanobacteria bacterium J06636_28]
MTRNLTEDSSFESILRQYQRGWVQQTVRLLWLLGLIFISVIVVELLNVERMVDSVPAMANLLGEMLPPDFSRFPQWIEPILDTLAMSIAGTAIAIVLSLPLCLLAARNTTPNLLTFHGSRTVLNITRAIPELILGMILVAAVGFG